tara:strand:+ start:694 stop:903 length:210 start_codon:yes stop_codon:yes gene_type:complete
MDDQLIRAMGDKLKRVEAEIDRLNEAIVDNIAARAGLDAAALMMHNLRGGLERALHALGSLTPDGTDVG